MNDIIWTSQRMRRVPSENKAIRAGLMAAGGYMYQLAGEAGIDESTLYRWLRYQLSAKRYACLTEAIHRIGLRNGVRWDVISDAIAPLLDDDLASAQEDLASAQEDFDNVGLRPCPWE